jgi:hypothetical protein
MEIYEQEVLDGIGELIKSTASVIIESPLKNKVPSTSSIDVAKALVAKALSNPDQIDLYYLDCILASIGWNKNDDVFDKYEMWKARLTPVDKPFNLMHDGNDIIGHITGSLAINPDGEIIDDETELDNLPDIFDIYTSSVIYKVWPDDARTEQIAELIEEIDEGKWFVSMECLFPGFDYAVIDSEGNEKIIERTKETAFLTKHLRAYKGKGEYKGYKIGRLLRDFTFSGKGLVNEPANPRSVILNDVLTFSGTEASVQIFSETKGNIQMTDINVDQLQKTVEKLEKALANAQTENIQMKSKADEEAKQSYETKIADLDKEIAEIKTQLVSKEGTIAELQTAISESKTVAQTKEDELVAIKAEMLKVARSSKLTSAGVELDKVEAIVSKYASVDETIFDDIVSLHAEAKKAMCAKDSKDEEAKCATKAETAEEVEAKAEAAKTPEEVVVVETPAAEVVTNGESEKTVAKVREIAKAGLKNIFSKNRAVKTENK